MNSSLSFTLIAFVSAILIAFGLRHVIKKDKSSVVAKKKENRNIGIAEIIFFAGFLIYATWSFFFRYK